jgi:hypothetical protein
MEENMQPMEVENRTWCRPRAAISGSRLTRPDPRPLRRDLDQWTSVRMVRKATLERSTPTLPPENCNACV